MIGVTGVRCQAVLVWTGLKIADMRVDAAPSVIAAAWLSGPRAPRLPAVEEEAYGVAAEFRCCPHLLCTCSSSARASFVLLFVMRGSSSRVCVAGLLFWRASRSCWHTPFVRVVPPSLSQLPVGEGCLFPVSSAG